MQRKSGNGKVSETIRKKEGREEGKMEGRKEAKKGRRKEGKEQRRKDDNRIARNLTLSPHPCLALGHVQSPLYI